MNKWGWEKSVQLQDDGSGIIILDDWNLVGCLEELEALRERLHELAVKLGWEE